MADLFLLLLSLLLLSSFVYTLCVNLTWLVFWIIKAEKMSAKSALSLF